MMALQHNFINFLNELAAVLLDVYDSWGGIEEESYLPSRQHVGRITSRKWVGA